MRSSSRGILAAIAAATMLVNSTVAAAQSPQAPSQATAQNPWVSLSMLTPSGAVALDGTAVAAQASYPPPEAPSDQGMGGLGGIPWPVLAVWFSVVALDIYLIVKGDDNGNGEPNSPD